MTAEVSFFRRDVLVGAPAGRKPAVGKGHEPFALVAPSGEIVAVQELAIRPGRERRDAMRHYPDQDEVDRVWVAFRAPEVPASGLGSLAPRAMRQAPPPAGLETGEGLLANRRMAVHLSPIGALGLEDRRTGERYDGLARLEDEPDAGDTYTFSRGAARAVRHGIPGSRSVVAGGPLVGAVEARWSMKSAGEGGLGLRLLAVLHADSAVVRLRFDVDNGAGDHRLRARFPVGAGGGGVAVAGAAFGTVRRPPATAARRGAALEHPVAMAPAQRFVAAAAGARGLVVLAPGFFEYEWTRKGELVVTLLRAVGELSRAGLAERPGHAGWPEPTPLAQEPGRHTIELALVPVAEDDLGNPDRLERLWEEAFLPVQAVFLRDFVPGT